MGTNRRGSGAEDPACTLQVLKGLSSFLPSSSVILWAEYLLVVEP